MVARHAVAASFVSMRHSVLCWAVLTTQLICIYVINRWVDSWNDLNHYAVANHNASRDNPAVVDSIHGTNSGSRDSPAVVDSTARTNASWSARIKYVVTASVNLSSQHGQSIETSVNGTTSNKPGSPRRVSSQHGQSSETSVNGTTSNKPGSPRRASSQHGQSSETSVNGTTSNKPGSPRRAVLSKDECPYFRSQMAAELNSETYRSVRGVSTVNFQYYEIHIRGVLLLN